MIHKRTYTITLILLSAFILTGCWNYREVDNFSIVAGVAIDKTEDGRYDLSIEIVDLSGDNISSKIVGCIVESTGSTLFDAVRKSLSVTAPKLYWSHAEVVIISKEVAQDSVFQILDWFARDSEPRLNTNLLISGEESAKALFETQGLTEGIRSYELNKMLDAQENLQRAPKIEVYEFNNLLAEEGVSAYMPIVRSKVNDNENTTFLEGTALFKSDRLIGTLTGDETPYFQFVIDTRKGGIIPLSLKKEDSHDDLSLELLESKTNVTPRFENQQLSMEVKIQTRLSLAESGTSTSFTSEDEKKKLEKAVEDHIKDQVINVISKVQKEYGVDCFGFGNTLKKKKPQLWNQYGENWEQHFKTLPVTVSVKAELINSAQLYEPVKVGD